MVNIYCDESCHTLHDRIPIMALGAVSLKDVFPRSVNREIREIKDRCGCRGELKWTKVSPKNLIFYLKLLDYFFEHPNLAFRALIVLDKTRLDHTAYNEGEHDSFYFKMYYYLIRNIVENHAQDVLRVYQDIKDTRSGYRIRYLHKILANEFHDFKHEKIQRVQQIRSHESELMQLCDFMLGAAAYANRGLTSSVAKRQIVHALEQRLGQPLTVSTPPWDTKMNLFHFMPREE